MAQAYERIFNFSAGPSTLPVSVLEQARDEIMNYRGTGMSVMEMSHRSKPFESIIGRAEADFRALLGISEDYKVLFLQGGASLQFSMVPICFLQDGAAADYVVTGAWGKKAVEAARLEGTANVIWDGKAENYRSVPDWSDLVLTPGAAYLHMTTNETIQGVEFPSDPTLDVPVVCDMSSDIASRPVAIDRYALIYAGAQKNLGPAGVTLVIVRKDFLAKVAKNRHPMLDYRLQAENDSLYNTPCSWGIYICGLVFRHLLETGGVAAAAERNAVKSATIYQAIETSGGFYKGHACAEARSKMNVTFTLPSDDLTKTFVKEAEANGMDGLKGHRSVGGVRASIYNAFPQAGCDALAAFMTDFASRNG